MGYRNIHFHIMNTQKYEGQWMPAEIECAIEDEAAQIFYLDGWEEQPKRFSGESKTITKGKQELYLHPSDFSGVIEEDSVPEILQLLEKAKTFECFNVARYETYVDMSDEAYMQGLRACRNEIADALLKECKNKGKMRYQSLRDVLRKVTKQFAFRRLNDKGKDGNKAVWIVQEVLDELLAQGNLIREINGSGIRTATKKESCAAQVPGQCTL